MKNYYDILEVSEKASLEIIERAYKVLAKKYHPDLNPENPEVAAEKFKEITEAYETISNENLRKEYDAKLQQERSNEIKERIVYKYVNTKPTGGAQNSITMQERELKNHQEGIDNDYKHTEFDESEQRIMLEYERRKAYNDAYIEALRSMGYTIVYKKTFKDYVHMFFTLLITILVIYVLLKIPFVKNYIVDLYNENEILQLIGNLIKNLFIRN